MFDPADDAESGTGEDDLFLVRFDEVVRPTDISTQGRGDAALVLGNFEPPLVEQAPPLTTTVKGRARQFAAGYAYKWTHPTVEPMAAVDSLGVAAIVYFDIDAQIAYGDRGVIIEQGVAELLGAFEVSLEPVSGFDRTAKLRLSWFKSGVETYVVEGEFVVPERPFVVCASKEFKRDLSDYYTVRLFAAGLDLGSVDVPLKQDTSPTGTTRVGAGAVTGGSTPARYFHGVIDCVHVVNRAITTEEAELLDWLVQEGGPAGYIAARDAQASTPEFPGAWPTTPSSWVQRELRVEGAGLALARRTFRRLSLDSLPHRAWGSWLRVWEDALGISPRPTDEIALRRARTAKKLRSVLGQSKADIRSQLAEALGYSDAEVAAGKPIISEPGHERQFLMEPLVKVAGLYSTGHPGKAWLRNANTNTTFTEPVGANNYVQFDIGGVPVDLRYNGWQGQAGLPSSNAPMYIRYLGGSGSGRENENIEGDSNGGKRLGMHVGLLAYPTKPASPSNLLVGGVIGSILDDEWLWFGVRWNGASYDLVTLKYVGGVLDAAFTTYGTSFVSMPQYFRVLHQGDGHNNLGKYILQVDSAADFSGATEHVITGGPSNPEFGGFSWVTPSGVGSVTGPATIRFDELWQWYPDGEGDTNVTVYRGPSDNSVGYDTILANEILQSILRTDKSGTVVHRLTGISYANAGALLDYDPLQF